MTEKEEKEEYHCEVCGRKISKEEHESYDGLCWECWDDQMTEECEFEEDIILKIKAVHKRGCKWRNV